MVRNILFFLLKIGFLIIFIVEFFTNVKFGINFLAFFLFSSAMTPVIFLCSTIASTTRQANLIGFFMFLSGLFLQMIFTNGKLR